MVTDSNLFLLKKKSLYLSMGDLTDVNGSLAVEYGVWISNTSELLIHKVYGIQYIIFSIWIKGQYNCIQCWTVIEEMDPSMIRKKQISETYRNSNRCKVHINCILCFPTACRLYQGNISRASSKRIF